MPVIQPELAVAHRRLADSVHKLWDVLEPHAADSHRVDFDPPGRPFNVVDSLATLLRHPHAEALPANLQPRYGEDMREVVRWQGGRGNDLPEQHDDSSGWVELTGIGRPEYQDQSPPFSEESASLVLDISHLTHGTDPGCALYVRPMVQGADGTWKPDDEYRIIEARTPGADPSIKPATLEEVLALDALVQAVHTVIS
jgi:hypothetical protein